MEFENLLFQLYISYLEARRYKRNTINQLEFEIYLEKHLCELAESIIERTYKPKKSIAFIINKPVQREIFAADFSDRVIHHLIYRCIYNDHIDPKLIEDSYSCRIGKGTLYGTKRANHFIRSCSENYSKDAYVLKLDIAGYFMNMNHQFIYDKVIEFLNPQLKYYDLSFDTIDFLLQKTIFLDVTKNCRVKGPSSNWDGLPSNKSLFGNLPGYGLPIGNLTSQIFGNIYMNDIDHYVKNDLKIKHYGRYVDDMIFVHTDKNLLKNIIPKIQTELDKCELTIHPKKIYLQHFSKGVYFLGHYIKPYRSYISDRTKNNFYRAVKKINFLILKDLKVKWETMVEIRTLLNSYLGILSHLNSYNLITKAVSTLVKKFHQFFLFTENYSKSYINKDYWQWHYTIPSRYLK